MTGLLSMYGFAPRNQSVANKARTYIDPNEGVRRPFEDAQALWDRFQSQGITGPAVDELRVIKAAAEKAGIPFQQAYEYRSATSGPLKDQNSHLFAGMDPATLQAFSSAFGGGIDPFRTGNQGVGGLGKLIDPIMSGIGSVVEPIGEAMPSASRVGDFMDRSGLGDLITYGTIATAGLGALGGFGVGPFSGGAASGAGGGTSSGVFGGNAAGGSAAGSAAGGAVPASGVFGAPTASQVIGSGAFGAAPASVGSGVIGGGGASSALGGGGGGVFSNLFGGGGGMLGNLPNWAGPAIGGGLGLLDSLNQPDSHTVTSETSIPEWLRPILEESARTGGRTLSGLEGYLRNTGLLGDSPMSFLPQDSRGALEGLTTGTSPSLTALNQTAAGDFLHGGSGFNAALEAAQRQIQPSVLSAFGRGGAGAARGGLAQTAMTRAIADAFAGLYGQERSNQLNASRSLGGIQLSALPQLAGLNQMELNAPIDARSRLLGASFGQIPSLSPLFGSNQMQPIYSNPLGGLLGGIGLGSSFF